MSTVMMMAQLQLCEGEVAKFDFGTYELCMSTKPWPYTGRCSSGVCDRRNCASAMSACSSAIRWSAVCFFALNEPAKANVTDQRQKC